MTVADVVLSQPALAEVRASLDEAAGRRWFGLLVGDVFEDPTCARRWALVRRSLAGTAVGPEPTVAELEQLTADALGGVADAECLLGWYATHPDSGLYLAPEEAEFHDRRFPESWQPAVVLTGSPERLAGGVFQRTDPEGLSRSVYAPFYEQVDPSSEFSGTTRRTFVAWHNYQTESRVVPAGEGIVSAGFGDSGGPSADRGRRAVSPPRAGAARAPEHTGSRGRPDRTGADGVGGTARHAPDARRASTTELPLLDVDAGTETAAAAASVEEPAVPVSVEEPTATAPVERPAAPASVEGPAAPAPVEEPPTGPIERDEQRSVADVRPDDSEAAWDKRQIERSLMAVGRSLTPASLGVLGHPAGEHEFEAADDDNEASVTRIERAPPSPHRTSVSPTAGPIPVGPDSGGEWASDTGSARRYRRRRRIPAVKIVTAAAGLVVLAASGWFGSRMVAHVADGGASIDAADGAESNAAGLALGPGELVAGRSDRGSAAAAEPVGPDPESAPTASNEAVEGGNPAASGPNGDVRGAGADQGQTPPGSDPSGTAATGGPAAGSGPTAGTGSVPLGAVESDPSDLDGRNDRDSAAVANAGPDAANAAPMTLSPPDLSEIVVDDPVASAYRNALEIFRKELARYDGYQREFDEGLLTCNPLNLSFRGVRDAFRRLERRAEDTGAALAQDGVRAFESAGRQFTVVRTHYELTDCPMPIGG